MLHTIAFGKHISHLSFSGTIWFKVFATVCVIAITALAAQIRIPLAWTPVPVTGQTFAVLLAGVLLGKRWGSGGMLVYGALGIAGVPWFNAASSGFGATTGYIIGFVIAAYFVGYFVENSLGTLTANKLMVLLLCGGLLIYLPGIAWLYGWLNIVGSQPAGLIRVIEMGAVPFIAGDLLKAAMAAGIGWIMLGRLTGREVD